MKRTRLLGVMLTLGVTALLSLMVAFVFRQASAQLTLSNEYELDVDA